MSSYDKKMSSPLLIPSPEPAKVNSTDVENWLVLDAKDMTSYLIMLNSLRSTLLSADSDNKQITDLICDIIGLYNEYPKNTLLLIELISCCNAYPMPRSFRFGISKRNIIAKTISQIRNTTIKMVHNSITAGPSTSSSAPAASRLFPPRDTPSVSKTTQQKLNQFIREHLITPLEKRKTLPEIVDSFDVYDYFKLFVFYKNPPYYIPPDKFIFSICNPELDNFQYIKKLKDEGFTAGELREAGFSARHLSKAGFSPSDLRLAGFTDNQILKAGFPANQLMDAGFSIRQLKDSEYTVCELLSCSTMDDLISAGFTDAEIDTGRGIYVSMLKYKQDLLEEFSEKYCFVRCIDRLEDEKALLFESEMAILSSTNSKKAERLKKQYTIRSASFIAKYVPIPMFSNGLFALYSNESVLARLAGKPEIPVWCKRNLASDFCFTKNEADPLILADPKIESLLEKSPIQDYVSQLRKDHAKHASMPETLGNFKIENLLGIGIYIDGTDEWTKITNPYEIRDKLANVKKFYEFLISKGFYVPLTIYTQDPGELETFTDWKSFEYAVLADIRRLEDESD